MDVVNIIAWSLGVVYQSIFARWLKRLSSKRPETRKLDCRLSDLLSDLPTANNGSAPCFLWTQTLFPVVYQLSAVTKHTPLVLAAVGLCLGKWGFIHLLARYFHSCRKKPLFLALALSDRGCLKRTPSCALSLTFVLTYNSSKRFNPDRCSRPLAATQSQAFRKAIDNKSSRCAFGI